MLTQQNICIVRTLNSTCVLFPVQKNYAVQSYTRYFSALENVSAILSSKLRPMMEYIEKVTWAGINIRAQWEQEVWFRIYGEVQLARNSPDDTGT